jgi:hypothetical protein
MPLPFDDAEKACAPPLTVKPGRAGQQPMTGLSS